MTSSVSSSSTLNDRPERHSRVAAIGQAEMSSGSKHEGRSGQSGRGRYPSDNGSSDYDDSLGRRPPRGCRGGNGGNPPGSDGDGGDRKQHP